MNPPRILIACIGNIFRGDDAFGVEVAKRFVGRQMPDGVRVVDYGIRGYDLAYALQDGPEVAILVDASPRGGRPGTLYLIEPDPSELDALDAQPAVAEAHGLNPMVVFRLVASMGGTLGRILVLGCEPATLGSDDEGAMGLSEPVERAVDEAVVMIESLVDSILDEERTGTMG